MPPETGPSVQRVLRRQLRPLAVRARPLRHRVLLTQRATGPHVRRLRLLRVFGAMIQAALLSSRRRPRISPGAAQVERSGQAVRLLPAPLRWSSGSRPCPAPATDWAPARPHRAASGRGSWSSSPTMSSSTKPWVSSAGLRRSLQLVGLRLGAVLRDLRGAESGVYRHHEAVCPLLRRCRQDVHPSPLSQMLVESFVLLFANLVLIFLYEELRRRSPA